MGNFGSNVIEHPGSDRSFTHQRARRTKINADKHWSFYRFLHLALDSCETFADSADKKLQLGHGAAAHSTLRYAEEAFEEAQHYFHELNWQDGKKEIESVLDAFALRLDGLWVRLMSSGYSMPTMQRQRAVH
jgi:hypothetical protein